MPPSKETLLDLLQQEGESLALFEIHAKLGGVPAERTLRRWLSELVASKLVEKTGQKRGTKYQIIAKDLTSSKTLFSPKNQEIIDLVRRPLYERSPIGYNENWLSSYVPNQTFYVPLHVRSKLRLAGERSHAQEPAGTYAKHVYHRLMIDLSYHSSRLEGNTYSLLDTEKLIVKGVAPDGKLDEEKTMILNHKEAIRYLVDSAHKLTLSLETLFTLHFLLADGLIEHDQVGKVRDHMVRIAGSAYHPLGSPSKILANLETICQKGSLIKDPYEQSFFLLLHISYLQAFTDVNKRTARLSCNIPLIKNNLVPLSFNDIEKDDYTSAMIAVYELQNIEPMLELYTFSYLRTCAAYDSTVKLLGFDHIRVIYRYPRRAILREIIQNQLTGPPLAQFISRKTTELLESGQLKLGDKSDFLNDLDEDIQQMDSSRIFSLGVTPQELDTWLNLMRK